MIQSIEKFLGGWIIYPIFGFFKGLYTSSFSVEGATSAITSGFKTVAEEYPIVATASLLVGAPAIVYAYKNSIPSRCFSYGKEKYGAITEFAADKYAKIGVPNSNFNVGFHSSLGGFKLDAWTGTKPLPQQPIDERASTKEKKNK